jgi:hypothetical protein
VHLVIQGLAGEPWIGPDQRNEERSEFGVLARELNSDGGKDEAEVPPVVKVPRTEERGTEPSVRERSFRNRLRNRGLPVPASPFNQ